ncbi:iron complex transport system ATP-binding protein [Paracoccus aminovorans]|uniref:Iron complex transport system ATP-binding protein n=1 Tax=Paracoccus aminovorans TaxID=34004 RepID=A0A1I3EGF4_9RHOB|nr:ABC transporter ATP-binding protein [Paracoccus aminovorans]CQR86016.1 ABC cobalamin/Fe3+-siderophore transporter, ATPase subunit [Paracoccus aminovorans]SFH98024.1 iron complex transport system ATP-binding protein [Paracoccus aminovorans]
MTPLLEVVGASRRGGTRDIVSDVSVGLRPGEMLGLVGPNGSGKSTLLNLMAGLLPPSRGEVRLEGRPLARLRRRQIAQRLAFVAQSAETEDRISVREAVEMGRTPWLEPLRSWSPRDDAAVTAALQAVDMAHMAGRDWSSLSGGERQRVHIARAHAQQPRILLLDEPTNHLDIHHQLGILDLIAGLGATTVIALHDLHHALRCDRVLVMQAGRCVALGPPAAVLTPALIREIFGVEAEIVPHPGEGHPLFAFRKIR